MPKIRGSFNCPPTTSSHVTVSFGIEPNKLATKVVGSITLKEYSPKNVISTDPYTGSTGVVEHGKGNNNPTEGIISNGSKIKITRN